MSVTTPSTPSSEGRIANIASIAGAHRSGRVFASREVPLGGGGIGSLHDNWMRLDDELVAWQHLWVDWDGQQVLVTELGSAEGATLDGVPLPPFEPRLWLPGQTLGFAGYTLQLAIVGAPSELEAELEPTNLRLGLEEPAIAQLKLANVGPNERLVSVQVEGPLARLLTPPAAPLLLAPGQRASVRLDVAPAQGLDLAPGDHPLLVRAIVDGGEVSGVAVEGRWTVPPSVALALQLGPDEHLAGNQQGAFTVAVRNNGNTPVHALLNVSPGPGLRATLRPTDLDLAPGETAVADLLISAERRLIGDPRQYGFQVQVKPDAPPVEGRFTQEPLVSPWLAGIAALSILLGLILFGASALAGRTSEVITVQAPGDPALAATNQSLESQIVANEQEIQNLQQQGQGVSEAEQAAIQARITSLEAQNNSIRSDQTTVAVRASEEAAQATAFVETVTAVANQTGTAIAEREAELLAEQEQQDQQQEASEEATTEASTEPTTAPQAMPTVEPGVTALSISVDKIDENAPANSVIGSFTVEGPRAGSASLSLVSGNDAQFRISGRQLIAASSFDYETSPTLSIRVRADAGTPDGGLEQEFTITINNLNEPPELTVSNSLEIPENLPAGNLVSLITARDPDQGDTVTISIPDNENFELVGDRLRTKRSFDFEATQQPFSLTITARDAGTPPLSSETTVTISVTNVNEAPTDIVFESGTLPENSPAAFGQLRTIDPDGTQGADFVLVDVLDANLFEMSGTALKPRSSDGLNYESRRLYNVRIKATDKGIPPLSFEKDITIEVGDVNEAPTAVEDVLTTREDTPLSFSAANLLRNDQDEDCLDEDRDCNPDQTGTNPLTANVSLLSNDLGTLAQQQGEGFLFTPAPNKNGTFTFSYTASDGRLPSAPVDVTINVEPVPDPPTADDVNDSVLENGQTTIDLPVSDPDSKLPVTDGDVERPRLVEIRGSGDSDWRRFPDNNELKVKQGNIEALLVQRTDNDTIRIKPTNSTFGNVTFAYRVESGEGNSLQAASATVTVFIQSVNTQPLITPDRVEINEYQFPIPNPNPSILPINLLANDFDPDNDVIRISQVIEDGTTHDLRSRADEIDFNVRGNRLYVRGDGRMQIVQKQYYNRDWDEDKNGTIDGDLVFSYVITDGEAPATDSAEARIAVRAVNNAPTLNSILDVRANSSPVRLANITVGPGRATDETSTQTLTLNLTVDVTGDNPISAPVLTYNQGSRDETGSITFTPTGGTGIATITVTVTDSGDVANGGINSTTRTFRVCATTCPAAISPSQRVAASIRASLGLRGRYNYKTQLFSNRRLFLEML